MPATHSKIKIIRQFYKKEQTEGKLFLFDGEKIVFECFTLELEWDDNMKNISCIPKGIYFAAKEIDDERGWVLRFLEVEGRSGILVHKGNFHFDILGCILVGNKKHDLNKDGLIDVVNSTMTMGALSRKIDQDVIQIEIL